MANQELRQQQGLQPDMAIRDFQEGQPLVEHRHFDPFIERIVAGEPDILWPGHCRFFVDTAGTTNGLPRRLPVTADLLAHFRHGMASALLSYAARAGHAGVFLAARACRAGASTALQETGHGYAGNFNAIASLSLSGWAESNLHSPPPAVSLKSRKRMLCQLVWPARASSAARSSPSPTMSR